jgi:hypothetical protein
MTLLAPSWRMRSIASRFEPSPTESIEITDATPSTVPSIVRKLRSLCSIKFRSASWTVIQAMATPYSWERSGMR